MVSLSVALLLAHGAQGHSLLLLLSLSGLHLKDVSAEYTMAAGERARLMGRQKAVAVKRLANGPPSLPARACEQALHAIGRRFACRFHQLPAVFALDQTQPAFQRAPHSLAGL